MKLDAMILAICHPDKLAMLRQVIPSVDANKDLFSRRMLMVDEFGGMVLPDEDRAKYESTGWDVIVESHHSRVKSMLSGVNACNTEWMFYSEDDIVLDLPKDCHQYVEMLDKSLWGNRKCGMLSLTFGGTVHDLARGQLGDLALASQNNLYTNDEVAMFMREDSMRDSWFFEFPGLFIRTHLLYDVLNCAKENWPGEQIEIALTKAWFKLGIDKDYFKASLLRRIFLDIRSTDALRIITEGRFFKIIDPTQGKSQYGGNHNAC